MTHGEYRRAHPGPGLDPTDCPGELEPVPTDPELRIELHRCRLCGRTISRSTESGRIVNDYEDPRPAVRAMLAGPASKLRAPR